MARRESEAKGAAFGLDVVVCVLALTVYAFSGALANDVVYERVAEYFGLAREITNVVWAALLVVVFFVASRRPSWLRARTLSLAAVGCAAVSIAILLPALSGGNGLLTVVGLFFSKATEVWLMLLFATALASLSPEGSLASVVVGISLGAVVSSVTPSIGYRAAAVALLAIYVADIALLYRMGARTLARIAQADAPSDLELANPESFLAPTNPIFSCILLFGIGSGYGLTLNDSSSTLASLLIQGVVLAVVAAWMIASRRPGKEDTLFSFSVLLLIAGFLTAPYSFGTDFFSANVLLRIGVKTFEMLVWLVVLAVGRRNLFALLPTFALAQAVRAIGIDVGAVLGHTTNSLVGTDANAASLIAVAVLFLLIAFLWLGFRSFSFTEAIQGVASMESAEARPARVPVAPRAEAAAMPKPPTIVASPAAAKPSAAGGPAAPGPAAGTPEARALDERIDALSAQCGLTERETEIFALLARGRNGQFIMDKFVISRNTVKTHVKHIYVKLDVHSQQELIDLVENAA